MIDTTPSRRETDTAPAAAPAADGAARAEDRAGREPGELVMALSPRQIIGGFALLAGLIVWLGRRRRKQA